MARAVTKGMIGALNRGLKYSTLADDSKIANRHPGEGQNQVVLGKS